MIFLSLISVFSINDHREIRVKSPQTNYVHSLSALSSIDSLYAVRQTVSTLAGLKVVIF